MNPAPTRVFVSFCTSARHLRMSLRLHLIHRKRSPFPSRGRQRGRPQRIAVTERGLLHTERASFFLLCVGEEWNASENMVVACRGIALSFNSLFSLLLG